MIADIMEAIVVGGACEIVGRPLAMNVVGFIEEVYTPACDVYIRWMVLRHPEEAKRQHKLFVNSLVCCCTPFGCVFERACRGLPNTLRVWRVLFE